MVPYRPNKSRKSSSEASSVRFRTLMVGYSSLLVPGGASPGPRAPPRKAGGTYLPLVFPPSIISGGGADDIEAAVGGHV